MGGNSSLWSSDNLLRTLDELQMPRPRRSNRDVDTYTSAGNLADYLGFTEVDSIGVPIPVNLIFVGFDGNGNLGLRIGEMELEAWFEHIDKILQHTRIPRSGHGPKGVKPDPHHAAEDLPILSYVHHNFSVHGINTGPKVAGLFEKALYVFSRKVDPTTSRDNWRQVDVDFVASLMGSLVKHLHLDDAYNIFLLNLKREADAPRYGYRLGYSAAELAVLGEHEERVNKLLKEAATRPAEDTFSRVTNFGKLKINRPKASFHWRLVDDETEAWVKSYQEALFSEEEALASRNVHGSSDIDKVFAHTAYVLKKGSAEHRAILRTALSSRGRGIHEECLVDAWVGKERFAFIDLSAGPFAYGPIAGGEGIRTEGSLPSVERIFSNATEKDLMPDLEDDQLERELEVIAGQLFDRFDENSTSAEVDLLMVELDVYEAFAEKHCKDRRRTIELCEELQERMSEMHNELWKYHAQIEDTEKKVKVAEAAARIRHKHRVFQPHNYEPFVAQKINPRTRARDIFLSQMGAVISNTLRHVVAAPTQEGYFRFHPKVAFHLYIVAQGRGPDSVDMEAFKSEIMALQLPNQRFQFAAHRLSLADDPALATAYAQALHSSVVPSLRTDGTYEAVQRKYLDSAELQHSLRAQLDHSQRGSGALRGEVLEVPIFLFVVEGPSVFLDQHHTARALPDMVLVVQSEARAWESQLQCNGNPVFWDLRNPLKGLVGATVQHLAGILPSHVGYSPAHGAVLKDWLWSVGANPLSGTSSGWRLSAIHRDAVHRNLVINALDASVEKVNAGMAMLAKEKTHAETFASFQRLPIKNLNRAYDTVVALWVAMVAALEELDIASATGLIKPLEEQSQGFLSLAESIHLVMHPIKCTRRRELNVGLLPLAGVASSVLVLAVCLVLRPRRIKPKIN